MANCATFLLMNADAFTWLLFSDSYNYEFGNSKKDGMENSTGPILREY